MGQLGLLLWKNLLRKARQPVLFGFEIIWPTVIFLVIVLVRLVVPPVQHETCHYNPRHMPSAGGVEFIQSFVCNLNNKCQKDSPGYQKARARVAELVGQVAPLIEDTNATLALLEDIPRTTHVLESFVLTLEEPRVKEFMKTGVRVGSFFQDENFIKDYTLRNTQNLSPEVVDAILNSKVNLNEIFRLIGNANLRNLVCDAEELRQYLIFPASVDIDEVSQELCDIDAKLIPNITSILQRQIDIAKILRLSSTLLRLSQQYELADGVEDLARLVDVLYNSNTINNLPGSYKTLQSTSDWLLKVAAFLNSLNGTLGAQVASFNNILNDLDPFVRDVSGDDSLWDNLRAGFAYVNTFADWANGGTIQFSNMSLHLESITKDDPLLVRRLFGYLNLTDEARDALLRSRINTTLAMELLASVVTLQQPIESLCEQPGGLLSPFLASTSRDAEILRNASDDLCRSGRQSFELLNRPVTEMLTELSLLGSSLVDRVNWTDLSSTTNDLVGSFQDLAPQISPILELLKGGQLQAAWTEAARVSAMILGTGSEPLDSRQLLKGVSMIDGVLRSLEGWPTIRWYLILANKSVELASHVINHQPGAMEQAADIIRENKGFQNFLQTLSTMSTGVTTSFIELFFVNEDILKRLATDPNQLQVEWCGGNGLDKSLRRVLLSARREQPFSEEEVADIDELETLVCKENLTGALHGLVVKTGVLETNRQIRSIVEFALNNTYQNLPTETLDMYSNVTQLVLRITDLTDFIANQDNWPDIDWEAVLEEAGLTAEMMGPDGDVTTISASLQEQIPPEMIRALVKQYGSMIENSEAWPHIGPALVSQLNYLKFQNKQSDILNKLFAPESNVSRLLEHGLRYLPSIMQAVTEALQDPQRRQQMLVEVDPIAVACNPRRLEELLRLQMRGIPMPEIQQLLCLFNFSEVVEPLVQLSKIYMDQFTGAHEDYKKAFDWDELATELLAYSGHQLSMITGTNPLAQLIEKLVYIDTSQLKPTLNDLKETMAEMTEDERRQSERLTVRFLEGADNAWKDDQYWALTKSKINIMNELMVEMNDMMKSMAEGKMDLSSLMSNSTSMRRVIETTSDLLPEMVDAMMNATLRPDKMVKKLLSVDLSKNSACEGLSLTDLMDFHDKMKVQTWEMDLCQLDGRAILNEMANDPVMQELGRKLGDLTNILSPPPKTPVNVDWYDVTRNVVDMLENSNRVQSSPLLGVDIEKSKEEFTQLAESYGTLDTLAITEMMTNIFKQLYQLPGMNASNDFFRGYNTAIHLMVAWNEFINKHLSMINGTTISIVDYVNSPTLRKILAAVTDSPAVTRGFLNGVAQILTNSTKMNVFRRSTVDGTICSDAAVFSMIFPDVSSSLDAAQAQSLFCGFNISALSMELMHGVDGLLEYTNKVMEVFMNPPKSSNLTAATTSFVRYLTLMDAISRNPPRLYADGLGNLSNPVVWYNLFTDFARNVDNGFKSVSLVNMLEQYGLWLGDLLDKEISSPEVSDIVAKLDATFTQLLQDLQHNAEANLTLMDLLKDKPETTKFIHLLPNASVAFEVLLDGINPNIVFSALDGKDIDLCKGNPDEIFVIQPRLRADFIALWSYACSLNFTKLTAELSGVIDLEKITQVWTEETMGKGSFSNLLMHYNSLTELVGNMGGISVGNLSFPWLNEKYWQDRGLNILSQFNNQSMDNIINSILPKFLPVKANQLRDLENLITRSTNVAVALNEDLLSLLMRNLTTEQFEKLLEPNTEFSSFIRALPHIPSVYEVLLTTAIMKPGLLTPVLSGDMGKLCDLYDQLIVSETALVGYTTASTILCNTDYSRLRTELSGLINTSRIEHAILSNISESYSISNLISASEQLARTLSRLEQVFGTVFTEGGVLASFSTLLTNANITMLLERGFIPVPTADGMALAAIDDLQRLVMDTNMTGTLKKIHQVVSVLNAKLLPLTRANVSLADLLLSRPLTAQLVRLLPDVPVVVEVYLVAQMKHSDKLGPIYEGRYDLICSQAAGIFRPPPNMAATFLRFVDTLCNADYVGIGEELDDLFGITTIQKVLNSDPPVGPANIPALYQELDQLSMYVTRLIESPPSVGPQLSSWLNQTIWDILWFRLSEVYVLQSQQSIENLQQYLPDFQSQLESYIPKDVLALLIQADRLSGIVAADLKKLAEKNLNVKDIASRGPETQKVLALLPEGAFLLKVIIESASQDPSKVPALVEGNFSAVCTLPASSFRIPAGQQSRFKNATAKLCSIDQAALMRELRGLFRINEMKMILTSKPPDGARFNLTSLLLNGMALDHYAATVLSGLLPSSDAVWMETGPVYDGFVQLYITMVIPFQLEISLKQTLPQLEWILSSVPLGQDVRNSLAQSQRINNLIERDLRALIEKNMTLSELTANRPHTKRLVESLFEVPYVLDIIVMIFMKNTDKIPALFGGDFSSFCNYPNASLDVPKGIEDSFHLVRGTFCSIDVEVLAKELDGLISINELQQLLTGNTTAQTNFNLTSLVVSNLEINKLSQQLAAGPLFQDSRFSVDPVQWNATLLRLLKVLDESATLSQFPSSVESLMPYLESILRNNTSIQGLYHVLVQADRMAQILQHDLQSLVEMNLTLTDLAKNRTQTKRLLDTLPDIHVVMEVVLTTLLSHPEKVQALAQGNVEALCSIPNSSLTIPPGQESKFNQVRTTLCSIDVMALQQELTGLIRVEEIRDILTTPAPDNVVLNPASLYMRAMNLSELVTKLTFTRLPDLNFAWIDNSMWMTIFDRIFTSAQDPDQLMRSYQSVLPLLDLIGYGAGVDLNPILVRLTLALEYINPRIEQILAGNITHNGWTADKPELQKLLGLMHHLQALGDIYNLNNALNPAVVNAITLGNLTQLCSANSQSILFVPPMYNQSFHEIRRIICMLNYTAFMGEVSEVISEDELQRVLYDNVSHIMVNLTRLSDEATMFALRLTDIYQWSLPSVTNLFNTYASYNNTQMYSIESLMAYMRAYLQALDSEPSLALADSIDTTLLSKIQAFQQYLIRQLEPLISNSFTITDLLAGHPESARLFRLWDSLPTLLEYVSYSLMRNSPGMQALLQGDLQTFCTGPQEKFAHLAGQEDTVRTIRETICTTDYNQVSVELQDFIDIEGLLKIFSNETLPPLSLSNLYRDSEKLYAILTASTNLSLQLPWGQESIWTMLGERLMASLQSASSLSSSYRQLAAVLETLVETPGETVFIVGKVADFTHVVRDQIQQLKGKNLTLSVLVGGRQESRKLVSLVPHLPAIISTILSSGSQDQNRIEKVLAAGFEGFCGKPPSESLEIPPGQEAEITFVWKTVCSINFTVVQEELFDHFQVEKLQDILTSPVTSPTNVTQLVSQVEEIIEFLSTQTPTSNFDIPWLEEGAWNTTLQQLISLYSMQDLEQSLADLNQEIIPMLQTLWQSGALPSEYWSILESSSFINEAMYRMILIIRGPLESLENLDETGKVFELLNRVPDALADVVIQASATPDKFNETVTRLIESLLVSPDCDSLSDLPEVAASLCQINWTKVHQELGLLGIITHFAMNSSTPSQGQLMTLTQNTAETQRLLGEIINGGANPRWLWLREEAWQNMTRRIENFFTANPGLGMDQQDTLQYVQSLRSLDPLLDNATRGALHAVSAAVDMLVRKLEPLTQVSSIYIRDLFPNSPEITKLLILLGENDEIMDLLLYNLQRPQFQELFIRFEPTWRYILESDEAFLQLIAVPPQVKVNVTSLRLSLRQIDEQKIMEEFDREFEISIIASKQSETGPVDYDALYNRTTRMYEIFYELMTSPINITLLRGSWSNISEWEQSFQQWLQAQSNPFSQLFSFANGLQLAEVFIDDPTLNRIYSLADAILEYFTLELEDWAIVNRFSLAAVLNESSELLMTLSSDLIRLGPDVSWLLTAQVSNPYKVLELLRSANIFATLCEMPLPRLTELFQIPDDVDLGGFYSTVCNVSERSMEARLSLINQQALNRLTEQIEAILNGSVIRAANLTTMLARSERIAGLIGNLSSTGSPMEGTLQEQVAQIERLIVQYFSTRLYPDTENLRDLLPILQALYDPSTGGNFTQTFADYSQVFNLVTNFTSKVLIETGGGGIQLRHLVRNVSRVRELLLASRQQLLPETVDRFLDTEVRLPKLAQLLQLSAEQLAGLLCDSDQVNIYFATGDDPEVMEVTGVKEALQSLCSLDTAVLVKEFDDAQTRVLTILLTRLPYLSDTTRPVNSLAIWHAFEELLKSNMSILEDLEADKLTRDLAGIFNMSLITAGDIWTSLLRGNTFNATAFADLYKATEKLYGHTDFWKEETRWLSIAQVFMDIASGKIDTFYDSGVSLSSLLRNSTHTRQYLMESFGLLPEVVDGLLRSNINAGVATQLAVGEEGFKQFCSYGITYPPDVNITVIRKVVCPSNFSVIVDELVKEFNLDAFITLLSEEADPASFSWDRYLASQARYQELLTWLFSEAILPSPPEFLGYRGNWTAWQVAMETALQGSLPLMGEDVESAEDSLRWLGGWLQGQMSTLSYFPETEQLVAGLTRYAHVIVSMVNGKLDSWTSNITLREILVNEPLLSAYLEETFALTPQLVQGIMDQTIDVAKLVNLDMESGVQSLVCSDAIKNVEISDVICKANYTGIQTELRSLIKWQVLMDEIYTWSNSSMTEVRPVNWTEFLFSFQELQRRLGHVITSPVSVTQLFSYPGDISQWTDRLLKPLLDQSANMSYEDVIQSLVETFNAQFEGMTDTSSFIVQDAFLTVLLKRLRPFTDGVISLDDLALDSEQLREQLQALARLTPRDVEILLQADISSDLVMRLLLAPNLKEALCNVSLKTDLALPDGNHPNIDAVQRSLCALDLDALSSELQRSFSIEKLTNQLLFLVDPEADLPPFNATAADERMNEFSYALTQLLQNPPQPSKRLLRVLNFTSVLPLLNEMLMQQPSSKVWYSQIINGVANVLIDGNMAQVVNEALSWINHLLGSVTNSKLTLERLMTDSVEVYEVVGDLLKLLPDLQARLTGQFKDKPQLLQASYNPILHEVICNETSLNWALAEMGKSLRNTTIIQGVICGKPGHQWYQAFVDAGLHPFAISEVSDLLLALSMSLMSNATLEVPAPGSTLADLSGLDENVDRLLGYIDRITVLAGEQNTMNGVQGLKKDLTQVQLALAEESISLLFYELEAINSHLIGSELHNLFLYDYSRFFANTAVLLEYMNTLLERPQVSNSSIELKSILPDNEQLAEVLRDLLSEDTTPLFTLASIRPALIPLLLRPQNLSNILCTEQFDRMFIFGEEAEKVLVDKLRGQLCEASMQKISAVHRLVDLLNLTTTINKMEDLAEEGLKGWPLVYEDAAGQMQRLVRNVHVLIANTDWEDKDLNQWLDPILAALESMSSQPSAATFSAPCMYLGMEADIWTSDFLNQYEAIVMGVNDIFIGLPEIEPILCNIQNMNLTNLYKKIEGTRLMDGILKIQNPSGNATCDSFSEKLYELYQTLERLAPSLEMLVTNTLTCVAQTAQAEIPALMEIDNILQMLSDLQKIALQAPTIPTVPEDLEPILNLFLRAVVDQEAILVQLSDVLTNTTTITEYLLNTANLAPSVVDEFVSSSLNVVQAPDSNSTVAAIREILCDPERLSTLVELPASATLNITTLSKALCNPFVNETAKQIREGLDFGRILLELSTTLPSYRLDSEWLGETVASLDMLIDSVSNLTRVFNNLQNITNLDTLRDILPEIQQFLVSSGPEQLYRDILDFVRKFTKIIEDPSTDLILADLMELGEAILKTNGIMKQLGYVRVELRDAVKDEQDLLLDLISLGVSPEVSLILLRSSFSFVELLRIQEKNIPELICNPDRLGTVLELPADSTVSIVNVSMAICGLNKANALPVGDTLINNLEIGNLIKSVIDITPSSLLGEANISQAEIVNLVNRIAPASNDLQAIARNIGNLSALADVSSLTPKAAASSARRGQNLAQSGPLTSLSEFLCGSESSFEITDEFNLGVAGEGAPAEEQEEWTEEQQKDMRQFETDFCVEMYKDIQRSGVMGRIAWSFVKPLMIGTVVYTPDTPATETIMDEALKILKTIDEVRLLLDAWLEGAESLSNFGNQSGNQATLRESLGNPLVSSAVEELVGVSGEYLLEQLTTFEKLINSDLKPLTAMAALVSNMTRCVDLKVRNASSEEELEKIAERLRDNNELLAGVVFTNIDEGAGKERVRRDTGQNLADVKKQLPKHIKYKIRMDVDNVPSTELKKESIYERGPEDNFAADLRYLRGFLPLQDMIEHAIIRLQTGKDAIYPTVTLQQMPYPCYLEDKFQHYISRYYFPIALTLAWVFAMGTTISLLMRDKETGMNQTMKVMGLRGGINWLAWFIPSFVMALIVSAIITLCLKFGALLTFSNAVIIYLYFVDFSLSVIMMSYLVTSIFQRATLAALAGLMIYLMSYVPYIIVISVVYSMEFWQKFLLSLLSTCAISISGQMLSDLEQTGRGIQWNLLDYTYPNETFTFAWCGYMMLIDSAIYGLLGWYISHLNPGKYGVPQPWYFPLSPYYWGCMKRKPYNKSTNLRYAVDNTTDKKEFTDHNHGKGRKHPGKKGKSSRAKQHMKGPGEPDPPGLPVGISLQHLTKKYKGSKKRAAVGDLSVNFYQGQVTALLGQNGAGKTTTINMLTGLFPPTSGTAYVGGYDILTNNVQRKTNLGFCPQANVLFDHMTVQEHLEFFCKLKASKLSSEECAREVQSMMAKIGLQREAATRVTQLSGGQQRRLSVALAFIGGSKVVILDEPTSGVDPAARRLIWDLILEHREGCTILLSTHHLDEAEVIGDRIVILHQGMLVCSGSPMFLKSEYGSGYNLTIAKTQLKGESLDHDSKKTGGTMKGYSNKEVLALITQYVAGARSVEEIGTEVTYMLPTSRGRVQAFQNLFEQIDLRKDELGIDKYGVSDTTLEEVFMKVTTFAERGREIDADQLREWTMIKSDSHSDSSDSGHGSSLSEAITVTHSVDVPPSAHAARVSDFSDIPGIAANMDEAHGRMRGKKKITGLHLKLRQFRSLITKRFHHNRRDLRSYLSQIILPCLFIVFAMACTLIKAPIRDMPAMPLTPALYAPSQRMFMRVPETYTTNHSFIDAVASSMVHTPGIGTTCMSDSETSSQCTFTPGHTIPANSAGNSRPYPGCKCVDSWHVCEKGSGGPPAPYYTTATGSSLLNITGSPFDTPDYILRTHIENQVERYGGWTFDIEKNTPKATVWFNNKGHHAMPAFYNALNNMVLRANIEGATDGRKAADYGISVSSHPLNSTRRQLSKFSLLQGIADTGIALVILCAFCFVPAGYVIYLIHENTQQEKQLQAINGVGTMLYWISALLWDMFTYSFTVALTIIIAVLFALPIYTARLNLAAFAVLLLMFGWATIPLTYLLMRLFHNAAIGYMSVFIANLFIGINTTTCVFLLGLFAENTARAHEIIQRVFLVFPQFALGDGLVKLSHNQFLADVFIRFGVDNYQNPFSFDMLAWHLVAMGIFGLVVFVLNLIIDFRGCTTARYKRKRQENADYKEDSDVSLERQRVVTGEARNSLLVLHNLTKVYQRGFKKVLAVENVCLGLPKGECFGLLGVNGAGKTSTFKMITGNILPTGGAATLNGRCISESMSNMKQNVGYCPQQDALDSMLTTEEMLYFIGRLKGIPEGNLKQVSKSALQRFGLEKGAKKTVKTLSGGNKRKLSTALALLGEPELVLLDEPTTGMDPATRRLVWNNIIGVVKDNRSVILTSHSMAECDALCTRLAIMVNGNFKALGSGQHLKNKFGGNYTMKIRLAGHTVHQNTIVDFILANFPGSCLKNQYRRHLEFSVPSHSSSLSSMFGLLEVNKKTLHIEDYSISQTTLDQLFVDFACQQTDGVDAENDDVSKGNVEAYVNPSYGTSPSSPAIVVTQSGSYRMRKSLDPLSPPVDEIVATREPPPPVVSPSTTVVSMEHTPPGGTLARDSSSKGEESSPVKDGQSGTFSTVNGVEEIYIPTEDISIRL